jgi:hypothetical protein
MIVICWYISENWEVSLFCDFVYFSTYLCIFFTVFYLFPPPNTLLSWYYYQILCLDVVAIHVLSICHKDMWKNPLGLTNAPVDEQIGHWNMVKRQYEEIEFVAVK